MLMYGLALIAVASIEGARRQWRALYELQDKPSASGGKGRVFKHCERLKE